MRVSQGHTITAVRVRLLKHGRINATDSGDRAARVFAALQ
jgi:hypothetical protein